MVRGAGDLHSAVNVSSAGRGVLGVGALPTVGCGVWGRVLDFEGCCRGRGSGMGEGALKDSGFYWHEPFRVERRVSDHSPGLGSRMDALLCLASLCRQLSPSLCCPTWRSARPGWVCTRQARAAQGTRDGHLGGSWGPTLLARKHPTPTPLSCQMLEGRRHPVLPGSSHPSILALSLCVLGWGGHPRAPMGHSQAGMSQIWTAACP